MTSESSFRLFRQVSSPGNKLFTIKILLACLSLTKSLSGSFVKKVQVIHVAWYNSSFIQRYYSQNSINLTLKGQV